MRLPKPRTPRFRFQKLTVERLEDRLAPDIRAVSLAQVGLLGATASGQSQSPSLSDDGRWLVFQSTASDLTSLPLGAQGVYLKDTLNGDLRLLTTDAARTTGVGNAGSPLISGDGRYVVFASSRPFEVIPGFAVGSTISNVFRLEVATGLVEAVSVRPGFPNEGANGHVSPRGISSDGNVILFEGSAANLVPEGGLGNQLFARDMTTGITRMVTLDLSGQPLSGYYDAFQPQLSGDGRYVVFSSSSPTLTNDPMPNGSNDNVFRRDIAAGITELVSRSATGTASKSAIASDRARSISHDGRFVAFQSPYSDVVNGADNGGIFVRDMSNGTTTVVSVDWNGDPLVGANVGFVSYLSISADGSRVAFTTNATGVVENLADTNNREDVFVRDWVAGVTFAASVTPDGSTTGNSAGLYPRLSADGSTVAFISDASNLTALADGNNTFDLFVRRLGEAQTILASANRFGTGGGNASFAQLDTIALSTNGQTVALVSNATDLVADDWNGTLDVFLLNPVTHLPELVTRRGEGFRSTANGSSAAQGSAVSADGRFVAFFSDATNLTATPTFGRTQLYVLDRQTGIVTLESLNRNGTGGTLGGLSGSAPEISANGRYILFSTAATDLYASPTPNGITQQVVLDRWTRTYELVSVDRTGTKAGNNQSNFGWLSPDGRIVVFASYANDLVDTPGTPGGVSGSPEHYIRNLDTGTTQVVAPSRFGTFAINSTERSIATPDGRFVVFQSGANDLLPGDFSSTMDVFVRDTKLGITELVTVTAEGGFPNQNFPPTFAQAGGLSADGRYVVFSTSANFLLPGLNRSRSNIYVRDRLEGVTRLLTPGADGFGGDAGSFEPSITPDGRYVLFHSHASDLVSGVTVPINRYNLYRYDLHSNVLELVSVSPDGTQGANEEVTTSPYGAFQFPPDARMTPDGRFITFWSKATNLTPDGGNGLVQVFVRDMLNRTTTRVSQNAGGAPASLAAYYPVLAANGSIVTFLSYASNLVPGDGNTNVDGFVVTLDRNTTPQPDLAVDSVQVTDGTSLGRPLTVQWNVASVGEVDAAGEWEDAVFLSSDPTFESRDRLLGTVPRSGGLAVGSSYTATLTAEVPAFGIGTYYVFVQANRTHRLNEGLATANNLGAAAPVSVTVPRLEESVAVQDGFTAANQSHYYRLALTSPAELRVVLDSVAESGVLDLYVRRNLLPTEVEWDAASRGYRPDQDALLSNAQPGVYYVLVRSREGAAATAGYSLRYETASPSGLAIGQVIGSATTSGPHELTFSGRGFTSNTRPELVAPNGDVLFGTDFFFQEANYFHAVFNFANRPAGNYTVRLRDGDAVATLGYPLVLTAAPTTEPAPIQAFVSVRTNQRVDRDAFSNILFVNPNSFAVPVPVVLIDVPNYEFRIRGETVWRREPVQVLATGGAHPLWMKPGNSGTLTVEYRGIQGTAVVRVRVLNDRELEINWAALKSEVRPAEVDDAAWDAVWANFLAGVGSTTSGYRAMLLDNAARLRQFGLPVTDVARLIGFELQQANAVFPSPAAISSADIGVATPGMPLFFARQLQTAITERYREGPLGRGWVANWPVSLLTDDDGNVTISAAGIVRPFAKAGSTYIPIPGDTGRLTFDGTKYILSEIDGSRVEFFADGRFDFAADANGNRITATYLGEQLHRLTHSSGAWLEFTYTAAGRIERITASNGEEVAYGFDASGEHLVSFTSVVGTVGYSYDSSPNPARTHALTLITSVDGTNTFYEYDERGRPIRVSRDGGALPVTYAYDSSSGVTATGPDGATTHVEYTDFLAVGLARDPLGREVRGTFDAATGRLLRQTGPNGSVTTYRYGANGRLVGITDANGRDYGITTDEAGRMTRYTDPSDNPLRYRYDNSGNSVAIQYPNGGTERTEYDPLGNPVLSYNRRNQATRRVFDANGRIIRAEYADLPATDFTYDSRGNLLTATDSRGTITLSYDSANRLLRVDYPGGRFLAFTYDSAGRRTQSMDQDGFTIRYQYDALSRLTELTDGAGSRIVAYQFDAGGRLSRADNGNGTFTTYEYDLAGQLKKLVNRAPDGSVNSWFEYTYDDLGRKLTETNADGTTSYAYDAAGQLLRVDRPGGRVIEYEYDAVGNRVRVTDGGITTDYLADAENRYLSAGSTTFLHDADGNLTRIAGTTTTTFTYDSLNRMTGMTASGTVWSFEYDQLGQRYAITENGSRREFLFDPMGIGSVVAEYSAGGTVNYVQGYGLVSRVSGGTATYYDFDGIGSTVGLTDASGELVNRYSYLPFGEVLSSTVSVLNPFTYVGRFGVVDVGNGLYQMRARDYSPTLGRFTTQDPIGIAGGGNMYAYTTNSPTNYVDLTGSTPEPSPTPTPNPLPPFDPSKWKPNPFFKPPKDPKKWPPDDPPNDPPSESSQERARRALKVLKQIETQGNAWFDEMRHRIIVGTALAAAPGLIVLAGASLLGVGTVAAGTEAVGIGGVLAEESLASIAIDESLAASKVLKFPAPNVSPIASAASRSALSATEKKLAAFGVFALLFGVGSAAEAATPDHTIPAKLVELDPDPWPSYPQILFGSLLYIIPGGLPLARTIFVMSYDPNDIVGPGGVGPERWLHPAMPLDYQVRFENDPAAASAAAQEVFVTANVDPDLDWDTLELGPIQFGDVTITPPPGTQSFSTAVDYRNADGSPLVVDVDAIFDRAAGLIRWTFRSRDPATGLLPDDAFAGFLPPNDSTRRGEGSVRYTARPKANLPTGTQFTASARIVFDTNAAIETNVWSNAIDASTPSTQIASLPGTVNNPVIPLTWAGSDGGSGAAYYTVHVSTDGGAFVPWLTGTTQTSAHFTGSVGHRYTFRVTAIDGVGFSESLVSTTEATTTVVPPPVRLPKEIAVGADTGSGAVRLLNANGSLRFATVPFPSFTGGVRVATADFNGDGIADVVVGTGPGGPTHVQVIDGVTGKVLFSVNPFEESFTGGVYLATGDLNGDGVPDLVITPDEGGGPRVDIYSGTNFARIASFFGIDDPAFRGGARAAIGDINGDGRNDLVVAAGFGGGPRIATYDGSRLSSNGGPKLFNDFFAFEQSLRNGVYLAVGDVNGDGFAELIAGGGPGGGPRVSVFEAQSLLAGSLVRSADFFAGNSDSRGGVRLAVKNLDGDERADLLAGAGTGAGSRVTAYAGLTLSGGSPPEFLDFDAFEGFDGGVFVG